MRKNLVSLCALAILAGLLAPPASLAAPLPAGENAAIWSEHWFTSRKAVGSSEPGPTLHADVLLPARHRAGDRWPVILSIGPYFGTNALNGTSPGPIDRFRDLWEGGEIFKRGFAWVQVDSRGFGSSDGCYDYGGPGEQADAVAAIEWAAAQEWSNGRVGLWGKSYDAWTQVMALASQGKYGEPTALKAAVVQAPIDDRYNIAFMNGVHYDSGWYATPALYGAYDLAPSMSTDSRPEDFLYPAKGTVTDPTCYPKHPAASAVLYDRDLPYWQEGELSGNARRSSVPIMWSHGFMDANTKPSNFMNTWEGYNDRCHGRRARKECALHWGWFGQWDHVRGNESDLVGRDGFLKQAMDYLTFYLKGGDPDDSYAGATVQDGEGRWRSEKQWPPVDADYDLGGANLPIMAGSYTDDGSTNATAGSWTWTEPAPYDLRFAGLPRLDVQVTTQAPNANLIAFMYDYDPQQDKARLVQRGAFLIEKMGDSRVNFELFPQDWILREGHRLGIVLKSGGSWFNAIGTRQTVTINSGEIELPWLAYEREPDLEGGQAEAATEWNFNVDPAQFVDRGVTPVWPPAPEKGKWMPHGAVVDWDDEDYK